MNKKWLCVIYFSIAAVVILIAIISMFNGPKLDGNITEYKCDVKNFRLATLLKLTKMED